MATQRVQTTTTTTTLPSVPPSSASSLSSLSSSSSSSTSPSTTSYMAEMMRDAALKTKQAIGEAATQIKQSIEHATSKPEQFNCEHCSALLIAPQTTSTLSQTTRPRSSSGGDLGGGLGVTHDWWQCSRPDCQFSTNRIDSNFCIRCGTAREVIGSTQKSSVPPLKVICSVCNKETKVPSTNAENQIKAQFHSVQRTTSKLYLDLSQQDYVMCPRCKAPIKLSVKPKLAEESSSSSSSTSSTLPTSFQGNAEGSNLPTRTPPTGAIDSFSTFGQQQPQTAGTSMPASMHSSTLPSMNFTPTSLPSSSHVSPSISSTSELSSLSGAMELECEKCQEKVTILHHSQLDKDQKLARPTFAAPSSLA